MNYVNIFHCLALIQLDYTNSYVPGTKNGQERWVYSLFDGINY